MRKAPSATRIWPGPGQLFVGTCYQPVDRTTDQIHRDIALMKTAGLTVVRMGDLSWDYFEPAEGEFNFKAFDAIMDEMHANGIKVILDISGLPAPIWLHHKYPGVDLVAQNGTKLYPAERYMDDIGDPDYRRLVKDFADVLTKHYANHPALFAVGFDNEIGNGVMSYSEADRARFIAWLKNRYGDLPALNKAWATQRWSRRIDLWDEIQIPYGDGPGPFEAISTCIVTGPTLPSTCSRIWRRSVKRMFQTSLQYRIFGTVPTARVSTICRPTVNM